VRKTYFDGERPRVIRRAGAFSVEAATIFLDWKNCQLCNKMYPKPRK
jgi:hypothetical protein